MSEIRERIVWDILVSHRIYRSDIAREIIAALDLPGKVNWASYMHDAAYGKMNYGRDRWLECERREHDAEYWAEYWQDGMRKQRYYFQRRAMLMNIDEARLS